MIEENLENAMARLRDMFDRAERILPFTGAGISTECGIPDFRSPGGFWTKNRPIPFDEFLTDRGARDESWRRRFAMQDSFGSAKPGRGHRALALLNLIGKAPEVITQNIDNLHQDSGILPNDVIELHGNTSYATCLDCGKRYELAWMRERFEANGGHAPDCDCGGFIKTATISFGQSMPAEPMRRAEAATLACDLFLVVGSSLVVWPAAGFPAIAKRNGAKLVIINRDATDIDDEADVVVRHDIGTVLAPFAAQ
ncbi:NAD-dependent protein deacetylase [Variibacter gotjawalensis]|uniref:protein acetyllysine N-acetyltransferase n=1 Tax=Variibacter gotjawalensis TaxID=1333996 RepID=A0A0S3PWW6_9BRAD|nr:Sir2 family NAD-dependent protein deacetylase [Variibacter gotjawalensis]NIK46236.1 NAD-dependent deacetylase [Variibacter gotjawalensis]RZS48152.1 NAD-dependent deacetylase [Variibacter gotjawalensis]BAT60409.1 NAD-dependent protein deacetylase [Variibacter gotjawalensis]